MLDFCVLRIVMLVLFVSRGLFVKGKTVGEETCKMTSKLLENGIIMW